VFREENFDTGAGGFCRFNENEFVFVRNDHHDMAALSKA
jgi:hypothetical protein